MRIAYGYEIAPKNDRFVMLAERVMDMTTEAVFPGVQIVNAFPSRMSLTPHSMAYGSYCEIVRHVPEWMPGSKFKQTAKQCSKMCAEMQDVPLSWVKMNLVCICLSVYLII